MIRRPRLRLEELDQRILPSATPLPPVAPNAVPTPHATTVPMINVLSGQGEGTFTAPPFVSGAGIEDRLSGEGTFAGLGRASISGSVHTIGFLVHGHATGSLTLKNRLGSVTLKLTGPEQSAFSPLPTQFSFSVTTGTGAYAHLSDHGTLSLVLAAEPFDFDPPTTSIPILLGPHGAFSLDVSLTEQPGAALDGALGGRFTRSPMIPDAGPSFSLTGTGTLAGAGSVRVSGWLQGTGMVMDGHAAGELKITTADGSLTLDLQGPTQGAFSPLPGQFSFLVTSGTGDYAHFFGSGTVTVHLDSLNGGLSAGQVGGFSLAVLFA